MTVIDYCTEEVRRQGHDTHAMYGIERVGWMLDAWGYALSVDGGPELDHIIVIGRKIERFLNLKGIRDCGVRVGGRICPDYKMVPELLEELFGHIDNLCPLEFYRKFEEIHPFVDGNGRTGKILLNWLNGTLLHPIFPSNDFWGEWIVNP